MKYFIAYKDEHGKDFNGQPWIMPEGGFDDIEFTKNVKNDFIRRGFKDVTLFMCNEVPEEIDWEFVNDNAYEE